MNSAIISTIMEAWQWQSLTLRGPIYASTNSTSPHIKAQGRLGSL